MADHALKTETLTFKVTREQCRALEERAANNNLPLGTWMRQLLLQAASQKPRKGYLHIREPNGNTI